ncbi:SulP family inorganic anion transporter [Polaribacter sp. WD7]|uniref:SulP family inorganic anion transporter n=1 Tax=Polaribacter sp. WD7 TaxID=2269061 RepID=UPI000DF40C96|nr:SulP family inorganic anion transporter [Polaribacter sp. WD7]RCS25976.1 SulP family inorganic anion transporter [Polaribacter sp. WD7]
MKSSNIPKKGFAALKSHFKSDIISGFSVSLIALPLCLGIAIASGVPPLAGLVTAIVGGIFASRISGTFVTISGPAAGLIVISLGAVESLGYSNALGAIFVAGLFVAAFGFLKVGKIGDYFPLPAVHGMLAAIGVIIIVKQLFPALGISFVKGSIFSLLLQLPQKLTETNLECLFIAIGTIIILIVHPKVKVKWFQAIPAPLWVLIFSISTAAIIGTEHLSMVDMPDDLFGNEGFQFPSFSKIASSAFWVAVIGFALVSGIESLLSAKAVDTLDPYKRESNLDRDLVAMGLGSSVASLIGGLPMISEIVRSSANISYGAKTQWANFYHGLFLLIYLFIGVVIIEMIPISALSAMLVFTGFKLASPKEFKEMYNIGKIQFLVFIITLISVLATDLIVGIAIGIVANYVFSILNGAKLNEFFQSKLSIAQNDTETVINLEGSQTFSNYLSLKKQIDSMPKTCKKISINFKQTTFVGHTVVKHLKALQNRKDQQGIVLEILHLEDLQALSHHPLADRVQK